MSQAGSIGSGHDAVRVEHDGPVTIVTLSRPEARNAVDRPTAEALAATVDGVAKVGYLTVGKPVIKTVALCGGAGDSLLGDQAVMQADVYITSDLRHHPASEALENARVSRGPALIDVSHWASEWLWLDVAARQLRDALPETSITVSELRTDPWDFTVVQ